MKGSEIRQKFIEYFEKHGHKAVHSAPVLPANDPTLLFVNAGMNQFKDLFLGNEKRDYTRAVSSQKCIRAGGKHNDLDEVGKTARHHTFFEMLGNFSFGDYFKEDAIKFAWDFLVNELDLAENRLWFSVFEGDDEVPADTEAEELWEKAGAKPERILRFGRKDNFWQMGDTGPCGPCSEIHYYMGDDPDNPEKNSPDLVNNDEGDTTMEIWNLVFMQFDRSEDGKGGFTLANLPAPSVDTGMGLERITAVMEGQMTNYETTLIRPIIDFIAQIATKNGISFPEGKELVFSDEGAKEESIYDNFDEQKQFACRVIADHARTTAFSIADGILPGNEGRNYVLRKIMRRAIYHGREHLGFDGLFFHKVCDFVIEQMNGAFPELETQRNFIGKMVKLEETRFGNTLTIGLKKVNELLKEKSITEKQDLIFQKYKAKKDGKPNKYVEEINEKINAINEIITVKEIASFAFEQKVPPTIIKVIMQDKYPDDFSLKMGESMNHFYVELVQLVKSSGTEKERELVKLFDNQDKNFVSLLDELYESYNFDDFAKLYDTYGVPRDLIRLKLEEKIEKSIPEEKFEELFNLSLERLQSQSTIGKTHQNEKINPIYKSLERQGIVSNFHGYERTKVEDAKVIAIVKGDEKVDELGEGDEGLIVLDETPFYAEAGGQVGDCGTLVSSPRVSTGLNGDALPNGRATDTTESRVAVANVIDTFAPIQGITLHKSKVKSGSIKEGDIVTANVDVEKRDAIRRNHTATHLVHSALKEVLGTHVKQAGSVVAPNYLRFDFTHYQAMSDAELQEIEDLVNKYILQNEPATTDLMPIEDAMKSGAVAMFGEKYGSDVRVLSVGDGEFSKELCGGTHVRATGDIGSFKITSDEAIASGVRRIRAITGFDAYKRFRDDEILIDESLNVLNTQRDNLPNAIQKLQDELKQKRKEVDELKLKIATGAVGGSSNDEEAKEISGVKVMAKSVEDLDKGGMRHLSDTLMAQVKSGVVIIGNKNNGKVSLIARVSEDLTDKIRAGNIIKEIAPIVGGKGGGRPDMAEGGGTEPEKLSEAMDASYGVIEKMLG